MPVSSIQATTSNKAFKTIGELAHEYKVTLRSLRFYEQRGLLNPLRDGHARLYNSEQENRLREILKGKNLGFTLTEIKTLLNKAKGSELQLSKTAIIEQIAHLENHRQQIDNAISQLRSNL